MTEPKKQTSLLDDINIVQKDATNEIKENFIDELPAELVPCSDVETSPSKTYLEEKQQPAKALAVAADNAAAPMVQMMEMLTKLAENPDVDVAKMNSILDLQERMMNKDAEMQFNRAMARLQPQLPQIEKAGKAHNSNYATLEDIDLLVKPFYTSEGFSINYNTQKLDSGQTRYIARVSHIGGHSEIKQIDLDDDKSGSKNSIQAAASTMTYAQRYLLKMAFNIIEKGIDNDGNRHLMNKIDDFQFNHITDLIEKSGADTILFCKHLKLSSLKEMTQRQYPRAVNDLNAKIAANKNKG